MSGQLRLDVIWARHEDGHGIPDDDPQFVVAFPSTLSEYLPETWIDWVEEVCDLYRDQCEAPVIAFYEGLASIERPESFDGSHLDVIELERINPGYEAALARLHPDPPAPTQQPDKEPQS